MVVVRKVKQLFSPAGSIAFAGRSMAPFLVQSALLGWLWELPAAKALWRDGAMARWRDGAMARWRDGAMALLRYGPMALRCKL